MKNSCSTTIAVAAVGVMSLAVVVDAYTLQHQRRPSFTGSPVVTTTKSTSSSAALRMDTETPPTLDVVSRFNVEETLHQFQLLSSSPSTSKSATKTLRDAEAQHGMPWKTSIDSKSSFNSADDDLLYMPFWEWQMDFMEQHLTDLTVLPCTTDSDSELDFSHNVNTKKNARIVNVCAKSQEYRKIRMTYYDAGDNTQVFNSVWYPDPKYNLPVLGIDLLAFNRKKYLAIVDFQPIHQSEEEHSAMYEHLLEPIKNQYDSLKGKMSSKFYDETQHFSQQMLFARFDDESVVDQDLFPAFQSYVSTHLNLIKSTTPSTKSSDVANVLDAQRNYDTYSAERDPATGLFAAMFGKDWAEGFVHDFLFSMSDRPEGGFVVPAMPFMGGGGGGGPPPQHQKQQAQPQVAAPAAAGARP